MKYVLIAVALTGMAAASDYQGAMFNLMAPVSGISQGAFELAVNHRFFGSAFKDDPLETFLGLDEGANVAFGVRYLAMDNLYLSYEHGRLLHRNSMSLGWMESALEPLVFEFNAGYRAIKPGSEDDWDGGMTATAGVSAMFASNMLRPVINFAYDGYQDEGGIGMGLEIVLLENTSLWGEYFPAADDAAEYDCFSFGARHSTWGHQFIFALTNNIGIGPQDQILGSPTNDLHVGFQIRRMI